MKNRNVTRSVTFSLVCLLLGIIIALQLKSINTSANVALAENRRVEELSQELMELMQKNGELVDKIDQLQAAQRLMDSQSANEEARLQQIIAERDRAEVFAGLTDVSGPGGTITLMPAKNAAVDDMKLRVLVNALRASGAQAISVNEQRLVSTSEIIDSGSYYVTINGQRFLRSGQFDIKVIMDPAALETAISMLNSTFNQLRNLYQIDTVFIALETVKIVRLAPDSPAYRLDLLEQAG
ncbi:MAG: DUF881 domain-containing protein [Clostridia bacterium]|nr:DUF881 domain-containing protein [Clostridia bacterium]